MLLDESPFLSSDYNAGKVYFFPPLNCVNIPFVFTLKFSDLVGKNGRNLPLPEKKLLKLANNDTPQMKLLPQLFVVETALILFATKKGLKSCSLVRH